MVKKVLVATLNPNFLAPILKELSTRDCLVHQMQFSDKADFNLIELHHLLTQWADCAFFDFCFDPLPMASHFHSDCRITGRLHGLEVYDFAKKVNWPKVHLVCSPPQWLRFQREIKASPASVTKVHIGVDVSPTRTPKKIFGCNIGLICYISLPRKRIYTTIETFYDLLHQSKGTGLEERWLLHVRGATTTGYRDREALEYLTFINEFRSTAKAMGLPVDQVIFHGYMEREQYRKFVKGLDVVISNSVQEGYHAAVFEAMSYGAHPFVHRWLGANLLFPAEFLFLTQRELVDKILTWAHLSSEEKFSKSLKIQKLVKQKHNEEKCVKQIVDVILGE